MRLRLIRNFLILLACSHTLALGAPTASGTNAIPIRGSPAGSRNATTQPLAVPSLGVDVTRMLAALAIVVGLILLSRWMLRKYYHGSATPSGGRAVQVLHRTVLAPRQQVILLQVGCRIVVVGESNGNMTTLAQIEDADEIAQLIGTLNDRQSQKGVAFSGLFGRAQRKLVDEPAEPESPRADVPAEGVPPETHGQIRSELSGLLEKVKSIRGQIGRE